MLPRLAQEPISSLAGGLLDQVVRDEAHVGLVDLALDEVRGWLVDNEDLFESLITQRAPAWVPDAINDLVARKIHVEALKWLADIRNDPRHDVRLALDKLLIDLADDLQHDPVDPGQGRAAQGARARAPAGGRHGDVAVGARSGPSSSPHSRTRAGRSGPEPSRGDGTRRAAARRRRAPRRASTPASATRRSTPSTATAPS